MKTAHSLLFAVCLLATGCSTYRWHAIQYCVRGAATNSADVATIKAIAQKAADQSGLAENPQYAGRDNIIASYGAGEVNFAVLYRRDSVWIELVGGHRSSPPYRKVKKSLASNLRAEFGNRVMVAQ